MDKNKIKTFAIWARRNLIAAVADRAFKIGIEENNIQEIETVQGGFKLKGKEEIFNISPVHRDKLISEIKEKCFSQVMEEAAYTWFNRFMGIRYMEVNEYLPTGIRVLSSEVDGKTEPDVLTRVSEVVDELKLDAEYIYELLDSGKSEDREKAYKNILVKQCNELGKIIPQMFEKISDFTELLLPDNLLEESSIIRKMVEDIAEEDWKEEVEIVGWMYQYYISEKKDEVFAALKNNVKITKENIPAATQLFTPKWIVKYMVENSLGRLWLEGHPNKELQEQFKYYLEEAEQEPEVEEELKKIREEHAMLKPEDIKVLDPCMGSGHILVYAFDVLYEIYKTAGYSEREIPRMILQNNLYGLDIDDRAAQLASFALIMKARHYNRRLFREIDREGLELNLCSIHESNGIPEEAVDYFVGENGNLRKDVEYLVDVFMDAEEYGSILEINEITFEVIEERLKEIEVEDNLMFGDYRKILLDKLQIITKQAKIMSRKYEICVTNPPYMGSSGLNPKMVDYINMNYKKSRTDLYSIFIEKGLRLVKQNKYASMITMHSWMFIKSFREFRELILDNTLVNMMHLGENAFEELKGEVVKTVSFIIRNKKDLNYIPKYIRLSGYKTTQEKKIEFENKNNYYEKQSLRNISELPGAQFVYRMTNKLIKNYKHQLLESVIDYNGAQNKTANNIKYIRYKWEIDETKFNIKWVGIVQGGRLRKWYGNLEMVVDWSSEAKEFYRTNRTSCIMSEQYLFREGICWTKSAFGNIPSFRILDKNILYETAAPTIHLNNKNDIYYMLGLLNSEVGKTYVMYRNESNSYQVIDIITIPYIEIEKNKVSEIVRYIIEIEHYDWDSFETSWGFKIHPLLKLLDKGERYSLSAIFRIWETECEEAFDQLKNNEEELNKIFIDIYGLKDELTSEVEEKDITIRKANKERDIKSFISYVVGCILGRYSIDAEGLIYAGGDFKDKWNISEGKGRNIEKGEEGNITCDTWIDATFLPNADNIIPITEDEYFEDDIVSRFIEFVRTVYSEETLEENLDFIADSIGRKPSETSRQAIRRYFVKDFYKDHLKVYQKRPIYWLFESGKNDGFKALVYMHRYNESTVAKVRTDYLHVLQRKYESEMNRLQLVADSEEYATKDRVSAKKKLDRISKQIEECREYDQVVAHLANEKISIDLDDGVMVNYAKFQGVKVINSKDKEVKMDLLAKI